MAYVKRYCKKCCEEIPEGFKNCPDCYKKYKQRIESNRPDRIQRGYDHNWVKFSKQFLKANPFCVECLKDNVYTPSFVSDHIIPHKGNRDLFWDYNNIQALCKRHHDIKTAKEDGGYGKK